jgi:hypothetical protein
MLPLLPGKRNLLYLLASNATTCSDKQRGPAMSARSSIAELTDHDAEETPADKLFGLITGYYISSAIFAATSFGLPDLLGHGPRGPAELAAEVGADAGALTRLMRLLASVGVLTARDDGQFELSEIGAYLRADQPHSMRSVALQFAGPLQQRTWTELTHAVRSGSPVFEQVAGTGVFAFFAGHPEAASVFNDAMSFFGREVGEALADGAYDFSAARRIVDVGGGHGALLAGILNVYPKAEGQLFELPHVAEGARRFVEAAGLSDRCEVVAGDIFVDPLPPGADLYLLKSVIHDFDNERAAEILRRCRRAMSGGSRLLLIEPMVSACAPSTTANLRVTGSDINMLVHLGGRERTEAEFVALIESCGFTVSAVASIGDLASGLTSTSRIIEASPA